MTKTKLCIGDAIDREIKISNMFSVEHKTLKIHKNGQFQCQGLLLC